MKPETDEAFSLYNHYLDALYDLTRAEYNARTGLVTRQNQLVVTEKQRRLAAMQQTVVEMWLSQVSTLGTDEDDPTSLTEAESGDPEVRFDG